jgi:hypothetical protein
MPMPVPACYALRTPTALNECLNTDVICYLKATGIVCKRLTAKYPAFVMNPEDATFALPWPFQKIHVTGFGSFAHRLRQRSGYDRALSAAYRQCQRSLLRLRIASNDRAAHLWVT